MSVTFIACRIGFSKYDPAGTFGWVSMDGPLRTAKEESHHEPGHGGCPAINPRHRDQWWYRWRKCQKLRHDRWTARRDWLMRHHADFGLSVAEAAAKLPQPVWVAA